MARTRLRQLEQIKSSEVYVDQLNQAFAEGLSGSTIGASGSITSFTTSTIVVSGDYVTAGVNSDDKISVSGALINNGSYEIVSLTYNAGETTFIVSSSLTAGAGSGSATITVDESKSLQRDLDHIRTQLKLLNKTTNWYDPPSTLPVSLFGLNTGSPAEPGAAIDAGGDYNAGAPHDLSVFLNGQLLQPSIVSGYVVTTAYDYQEVDASGDLVQAGDTGRKIKLNFGLISGDILQFVWNK